MTKFKVLYTLNNTGPLKKVAPPCPKKGVIGKDQEACVDYKQSQRRDGDLYLPFLFNVDGRMAASSADERRQRRPDDAQQLEGFVRVPCSTRSTCGQLRLTHPANSAQATAPGRRPATPGPRAPVRQAVCVGIIVLTCDPCSHSEQESALVRDVG